MITQKMNVVNQNPCSGDYIRHLWQLYGRLDISLTNLFAATIKTCQRLTRLLIQGPEPCVSATERESLFLEIVNAHGPEISRLCFGYARTRMEYEDLRQDALVNIWQGLKDFRGHASIRTWVYRVTLNTCVSTLRRRGREQPASDIEALYGMVDESDDKMEMIRELHAAISQLSPTDKAIMMLWLDEMSYEEIAEMTGLGRNTVATRLRRAKEKIRKLIN